MELASKLRQSHIRVSSHIQNNTPVGSAISSIRCWRCLNRCSWTASSLACVVVWSYSQYALTSQEIPVWRCIMWNHMVGNSMV